MKQNFSNLKEYLNDMHYDDIHHAVSRCIRDDDVNLGTSYIEEHFEHEIENVTVTSYYSLNPKQEDKCDIIIDAIVFAEITITGYAYLYHRKDQDTDTVRRYFNLVMKADIGDRLRIKHIEAHPIDERASFRLENSGTKNFIPYISEDMLDSVADRFIAKYYPEALNKPIELNVDKLADNIGLNIIHTDLPDRVFGQMLFTDKADAKTGVVYKRGTILVDDSKSSFNAVMDARCTVVHESLHWLLHEKFFRLLHLLNNSLSGIECCSVEDDMAAPRAYPDEFKWMEWQANALTPRILMPAKMAMKVADDYIEQFGYYGSISPNTAKSLIGVLSRTFNVSKTMAKIRLLQLGYSQFKGINEFSDDKSVPSYVFSSKSIDDNQTYTADSIDALIGCAFSPEVKNLMVSGKLVFVDGLFVINDAKYVHRNKENRKYSLTEYALSHADECALAFDVKKKFNSGVDDKFYSMCFACRTGGGSKQFEKTLNAKDDHNIEIIKRAREANAYLEDFEFCKSLPDDDFNKCFAMILDHLYGNEYNFSELRRLTKLDNTTISDYVTKGSKPKSLKSVLALISGLDICPDIAHKLLATLNMSIRNSNSEANAIYNWLITNMQGRGADDWNRVIIKLGRLDLIVPDSAKASAYTE